MLFNATTKVYSFKVVVVFFYNDLQYIYSGSQTLLSVGYIDLIDVIFHLIQCSEACTDLQPAS